MVFKFSQRIISLLSIIGISLLIFTNMASAQSIEDIKKAGVIRVGVTADQAPWGVIDSSGQNIGYDVDVARLIGDELGVKVQFVTGAVAARIPNLMTKKVDLQMAIMGMYPERAKVVQFTKPYAGLKIVLLSSKNNHIETVDDARKFTIAVPRGAAQDKAITDRLGDSSNIRRFDDDSSAMQALISNQVQAVGGNTTYKLSLDKASPNNDYEQKLVFNEQWMGIATRPKQKELNEWLNQFIDKIKADGRLEAINQKWLGTAMPDFPQSIEGVPYTVE